MQTATGTTEAIAALAVELDCDFGDEGMRFEHRDRLFALIEAWAGSLTIGEVGDALDAHGCCWGRYRDFLGMVKDDPRCSTENPMFQRVEQPGVGSILSSDTPLRFGAAEPREVPIAPQLGEHTDEVLAEVLGMSSGEIGGLHDRKVVAGA